MFAKLPKPVQDDVRSLLERNEFREAKAIYDLWKNTTLNSSHSQEHRNDALEDYQTPAPRF